MNTLGHVVLAGDDAGLILGGIIADGVKGRAALAALHPAVQRGVLLHRAIDGWSDCHPAFRAAMALLRPRWGHLARVLVDIAFDHQLAVGWSRHHVGTLRAHLDAANALILDGLALLPANNQPGLRRLVESDRLYGYTTLAGLAPSLERLEARRRHGPPAPPAEVLADLAAAHDGLARCFDDFWPAALDLSASWIVGNGGGAVGGH
jgi:acyl carrier protein phosphodiesterase